MPAQSATHLATVLRVSDESHHPVTLLVPPVCVWPARFHTCGAAAQQQWRALDDSVVREQHRNDGWLGEDKLRHFFASWAVAAVGFGSARLAGIDADTGLTLAISGAAIAGLAKEWADGRSGGFISLRDLVWDAAGIAAAIAILRNTQ